MVKGIAAGTAKKNPGFFLAQRRKAALRAAYALCAPPDRGSGGWKGSVCPRSAVLTMREREALSQPV